MADEDLKLSTEDAILDSIGEGGSSDDTSGEQSPTETSTEGDGQQAQSGVQAGQPSGTDEEADKVGRGKQGVDGQQRSRGPQDLVDREGNVIATGGKERRFYETAQREKTRADNLEREVQDLRTKVEAHESSAGLANQYSLTPEELSSGAQLMAAFKQDPVETVKYLLTQAQSSGHNIEGVGAGTDMAAINKMISDQLKPFTDARQAELDTQQHKEEALKVYNDFLSNYPDAAIHQDTIAQLLEKERTLSPEAAYFKLKNFYLEKGLDWNKSLAEHESARAAAQPAKAGTQSSLPVGRTPADNLTDTTQVASVDTDMDDIIKESMKEAGYNIN